MTAEAFLEAKKRRVETALHDYVATWGDVPEPLGEAMRYSLFAGGKRLRPALALGAAEIVGGDDAPALPAACALEMIHTYSLIHDDLPAMDDDAMRRGKPTCHVVYGEAMAILAGDALLTMAFDLLAETGDLRVVREVARASGIGGMAGGQTLDLQYEGRAITLEALEDLHRRKTGALIRASVVVGALLAGADDRTVNVLGQYGEHVGLAFQIVDDILDVTGDSAVMGKAAGSDTAHNKATFPAILGVEGSYARARELAGRATATLADLRMDTEQLRTLVAYIVTRSA